MTSMNNGQPPSMYSHMGRRQYDVTYLPHQYGYPQSQQHISQHYYTQPPHLPPPQWTYHNMHTQQHSRQYPYQPMMNSGYGLHQASSPVPARPALHHGPSSSIVSTPPASHAPPTPLTSQPSQQASAAPHQPQAEHDHPQALAVTSPQTQNIASSPKTPQSRIPYYPPVSYSANPCYTIINLTNW